VTPPRLLTVDDVAEVVSLSAYTVRQAIHDGELKASKLRGRWLVHPDDLAEWIDQGRARPVTPITPAGQHVQPRPPGPSGGFRDAVRRRRGKEAA
jgi:excisionase family DNA binding protein